MGLTVLAIFDVDETLIRRDSLLLFGVFILSKKGIRFTQIPAFSISLLRWLFQSGDGEELKVKYLKMLCAGMKTTELNSLAKEFAETVLNRNLYKDALDRMRWHKDQRHEIVLLSASLDIYLTELSKMLGANSLICTRLLHEKGVVTGEIQGRNCKGQEKLKRLLCEFRKEDIDWRRSFAYSDSESDLPILGWVGNAVVINPSSKLAEIAGRKMWKIEYWKVVSPAAARV